MPDTPVFCLLLSDFVMSAAPDKPENVSPLDWYRLFRNRIEHEDNLIIQRLSWLVASQAFLFSAYAITTSGLSSRAGQPGSSFQDQALLLFRLIPVVAICIAVLIYISILAALKGIRELRRLYEAKGLRHEGPPIQTSKTARLLGLAAPLVLPVLFVAVWLLLLLRSL
jgi:hypothetical protein